MNIRVLALLAAACAGSLCAQEFRDPATPTNSLFGTIAFQANGPRVMHLPAKLDLQAGKKQ